MADLEEGMARLRRLAARDAERPRLSPRVGLDPCALQGCLHRPGERVLDSVSGQEGEVVHSGFIHATIAAPGGQGD